MHSSKTKISDTFRARLAALKPGKKLRAIVMLANPAPGDRPKRRLTRQERHDAIEKMRKASKTALEGIDLILEEYEGRRLALDVDALGCIPIETTAPGIEALANVPEVRSIMEDQAIGLIEKPKRLPN